MFNIGIFGTGKLGSYFGALLQQNLNDLQRQGQSAPYKVNFFARPDSKRLKELHEKKEITVNANNKNIHDQLTVRLHDSSVKSSDESLGEGEKLDAALVCTRYEDIPEIADAITRNIKDDGFAVSVHNGVTAVKRIKEAANNRFHIAGSKTGICVQGEKDAYRMTNAKGYDFLIGEHFKKQDASFAGYLDKLIGFMQDSKISAEKVGYTKLREEQWLKASWNCAFNLLCTREKANLGDIYDGYEDEAKAIMEEVAQIAKATESIDINHRLDQEYKRTKDNRSYIPSTADDYNKGRNLELVFFQDIVDKAKAQGLEIPKLEALLNTITTMDQTNPNKTAS